MVESDRPAATGPENFEPAMAGPPVSGLQPAPGGNLSVSDMWVRCDVGGADGIDAAIVELTSAGVPIPSVLAIADVRAMVRENRLRPYRDLAQRWGWGEKRARLLLQNEARWEDPAGGIEGRKKGAARAQEGRSEGADDQPVSAMPEDEGRNEGADGAQAGRKKGHARDPSSNQHRDQHQDTPSPAESVKPQADRVREAKPSKAPKEKNPFTEAWNEAWQQVATEKYPWPKPWHKVLALTKDLTVKPHSELVESASRFMKANATPKFERWLYALKDETIRSAMGRKHVTYEEAMSLFGPTEPMVEEPKPEPVVHKPPAYEADILAARERRTKPKEVSRG